MTHQASIWTMGEILVEIMRPRPGMALDQPGEFIGPFPSGAPAIFIDTVARLGLEAGIIGGVGEDDFGVNVLGRLTKDGVDCQLIKKYPGYATAVAFVTYFPDGSRKFIYHIDRTPAVMTKFINPDRIRGADFFHVMGCSLMASEALKHEIYQAVRFVASNGGKISFDPNIRIELLQDHSLEEIIEPVMSSCSVLLPGVNELLLLGGSQDVESAARLLFARYPMELIVVKRGKSGCTVFTRDRQALNIPAYPIQEIDPTGAGDCFDAGFLCGLLEGRSLEDCARMASAAGALNAAAFGPMEGHISRESIKTMIEQGNNVLSKPGSGNL